MSAKPKLSTSEMTDEEMIEWAKNHKIVKRKVSNLTSLSRNGPKKAKKKVEDSIRRTKEFYDPVRRERCWGDEFNRKNRLLYQHNEEFRELKKYRVTYAQFVKNKERYDSWKAKYYATTKDRMSDHAQTFKLDDNNFILGYTIDELVKYSPISKMLFQRFIKDEIIPSPKYTGYLFVKKSIQTDKTAFYLVAEAEAFLHIFSIYRNQFKTVRSEEQKLYLKKQMWTKLLEIRKNFDQDN